MLWPSLTTAQLELLCTMKHDLLTESQRFEVQAAAVAFLIAAIHCDSNFALAREGQTFLIGPLLPFRRRITLCPGITNEAKSA